VDLSQGTDQIVLHLIEGTRSCHVLASDQHVVPAVAAMFGQHQPGHFAQAALGPVSGHGVSDFLGTGIADTDSVGFTGVPFARLKMNSRCALTLRALGAQKVATLFQNLRTNGASRCALRDRRLRDLVIPEGNGLRAQLGATLGPTGIQDLAAGLGGHTGAETVAVLANPVGRLERALHSVSPVLGPNPSWIRGPIQFRPVL